MMRRAGAVTAVVAALAAVASPANAATPPPSPSIVGGTTVSAGWPWAVFVLNNHTGGTCSGALIATKTVATAAHCVVDGTAPGDLFVSNDRAIDFVHGNFVHVTAIKVMNSFNEGDPFSPDVAKLRIESALPSATPVQVINRTASSEVTGSAKALAGGYGATGPSDTSSPVLREAMFTNLGAGTGCAASTWICSNSGPPAACFGDSGGPLVVQLGADTVTSAPSPSNGVWRLAGLTHAGDASCSSLSLWANLLEQSEHNFLQPDTTIFAGPSGNTTQRRPSFGFNSAPTGAILQCRVDKALFKTCQSPFKTALLGFGPHTFQVRANSDGVTDPSPASRSFTVVRP
jgi:trypsin